MSIEKMIYLKYAACLLGLLSATPVSAGLTFEIQSFNGATATQRFFLGDTATIRVLAVDIEGAGIDFASHRPFTFNATLRAETDGLLGISDADDSTVFRAGSRFSGLNATNASFFSAGGRKYNASSTANTAVIGGTSLTLFEFDYTVGSLGDTIFSFTDSAVGRNNLQYSNPGSPPSGFDVALPTYPGFPGGYSFSVTAVPEPSTYAVLGAMTAIGLVCQRLRRRKPSQAGA